MVAAARSDHSPLRLRTTDFGITPLHTGAVPLALSRKVQPPSPFRSAIAVTSSPGRSASAAFQQSADRCPRRGCVDRDGSER